MKIILKNIKQEEFELDVESDDISVKELKEQIEITFNYDASRIKLLLNGTILSDEKVLKDYNVNESTKVIMSNIKQKSSQPEISSTNISYIKEEENTEEKVYSADIKAEDAVKIVASIMKVLCTKNKENAQKYFKNLEEDNPEIKFLLKQNENEFKKLLYSPVTQNDKDVFKQFYRGELTSKTDEWPEKGNDEINQLMEIGFEEQEAKDAYTNCSFNFNKALDYLLNKKK